MLVKEFENICFCFSFNNLQKEKCFHVKKNPKTVVWHIGKITSSCKNVNSGTVNDRKNLKACLQYDTNQKVDQRTFFVSENAKQN